MKRDIELDTDVPLATKSTGKPLYPSDRDIVVKAHKLIQHKEARSIRSALRAAIATIEPSWINAFEQHYDRLSRKYKKIYSTNVLITNKTC